MEDDENNEGNKVYTNRNGDYFAISFDLSKDLGRLSESGKNILVTTYSHRFVNSKGEKVKVQLVAYKDPPSSEINMHG